MCVHAKSLQSSPTLCNHRDCSLPGSSVHEVLHAGILEWVAVPLIEPESPALQADSLHQSHQGPPILGAHSQIFNYTYCIIEHFHS